MAGATAEDLLKVSIHAPARGATISPDTPQPAAKFQSTRPRGARPGRSTSGWSCHGFNPRAREGRDSRTLFRRRIGRVSIHAPARGATDRGILIPYKNIVSIHAPARGATVVMANLVTSLLFQSTRPRGARLQLWQGDALDVLFQSTRPRGARRVCRGHHAPKWRVSIHAPARGATNVGH